MEVSKISMGQPAAFQAKTNITAPEKLLSKEDIEYFESLGSKIGNNSDTIKITISDLAESEFKPNVKQYTCKCEENIDHIFSRNSITIPYEQDGELIERLSPKNYLNRVFTRLLNK